MAEKIVTFEVDKNGNFTIDAAGFQGKGCKDLTKAFEAVGKVVHEDTKPEYYQEGPGGGGVRVNQGR